MNATKANPVGTVLDEARRWLDVREDPPNSNRGVVIDFALYHALPVWEPYSQGIIGAPWCAAFVSLVGRLALGKAWPVTRTVSCEQMAVWARHNNVLYGSPALPSVGDLFLLYYDRLGRFGHVGFVTGVDGGQMQTIEGNTGPGGSREGHGVYERTRPIAGTTVFVRWPDAL